MNVLGKRFYSDGDTGGGGDPAPATPPAQNPPPAGESSAPEVKPDAINIQAEIDKRAKAIKREATQEARRAMLQEVGIEDENKLKSLVDAEKQRQDEETTAAEKLETEKTRHAADIQAWQKKYDALAIQNAFIVQAATGDHPIPADRQIAAFKLLDTSELEVGDDGTVTGIDEAIKNLTDENPFLIAQAEPAQRKAPDIGAGVPTRQRGTPAPPERGSVLAGKKLKL